MTTTGTPQLNRRSPNTQRNQYNNTGRGGKKVGVIDPRIHEQALCKDDRYDRDLWYAESGWAQEWAVEICNECPVKLMCYEASVQNKEYYGTWGGVTAEDRRNVLRLKNA